jgi:hypothetical protein
MKTCEIRKQKNSGRIKIVGLFLLFAIPIMLSCTLYYIMPPQGGTTNYGELIEPQRPIPPRLLVTESLSESVPANFDRLFVKKWRLISVHRAAACDQLCVQKLFFMRQLRLAQGAQRIRIVPIWLITDRLPVSPILRTAYGDAYAAGHFLYVEPATLKQWLPIAAGSTMESYLYLVDPLGHLMMRFPAYPDSKKMHTDLSKLLKWNPV